MHLDDEDWQKLYEDPLLTYRQTYGCLLSTPEGHIEDFRRGALPPACQAWEHPSSVAPPGDGALTALVAWQAGRCAGCGHVMYSAYGDAADLMLDHDHHTGLVRGLLCSQCNGLEGISPPRHPRWFRYRTLSPAHILGISVTYGAKSKKLAKALIAEGRAAALAAKVPLARSL
ncbi:endonuclease domain-containing protein [Streptomyces sp. H27-H1]|uniref:endonuclease domain-containing protein n=1 Tax=Streptomyces sp. H27-H1 TaxID=2996461 RepID=UPI00226FFD63|nr:endonuclease domain-containing protein [Streptomyces sp. H27-H1]MCY0928192.1 endonuclease domain-containing protein [Streptomyces sp. H27-H1]